MKKYYCLYRFLNESNEIIYIGKTCSTNPQWRFNSHNSHGHLPKECYAETKLIEMTELKTEADVMVYEPYLINTYKPKYNTDFKTEDNLTITLPDLEWISKEQMLLNIKNQYEEYKNTDEFKIGKIKNRVSTKGLTITQRILNWIEAWDGSKIKTRNILQSIGITQSQFDKAKENKVLKDILNKYIVSKGYYQK